jgi:hypothetical protein
MATELAPNVFNLGPISAYKIGQQVSVYHPDRMGYSVFEIDCTQEGEIQFKLAQKWVLDDPNSILYTKVV